MKKNKYRNLLKIVSNTIQYKSSQRSSENFVKLIKIHSYVKFIIIFRKTDMVHFFSNNNIILVVISF